MKFVTSLAQVRIIDTQIPPFRNDVYKYFQLPNHSSLQLPLKTYVCKYLNPPDHSCLVNIAISWIFISLKCQQVQ